MSEWRGTTLGKLIEHNHAELQTGPFGTMLSASEYCEFGTPVIAVQDIGDNQLYHGKLVYINEETAERLQRYRVKIGDIIFGRKGAVDRRALIKTEEVGWIQGSDCIRLRLDDTIDSKFVSYQFGTDTYKDWMMQFSTGATMPSLNQDILKLLPLFLPSLSDQRAIAEVLSSLDDKIELLTRQNATLEALAQTYFRQWFVEGASEEGKLGDYITLFDHKRIPLSAMEREKKKSGTLYAYYGAASIMDYINDYIFDGEYILLGEDGTVETADGYPVLQYATGKFWCNNHAHVIQAKPPFTNYTLWCFLKQCSISHIVTGAVQPKINQENLKSLDIPITTPEAFEATNAMAKQFFKKIISNNAQIQTLQKLRNTLLPKLVSGNVTLRREMKQ